MGSASVHVGEAALDALDRVPAFEQGLVYMQGLMPQQDFWLLDLTTHKTRQLTRLRSGAAMRTFDITPDGKQIVFDRLRENSDIVLIDLPK